MLDAALERLSARRLILEPPAEHEYACSLQYKAPNALTSVLITFILRSASPIASLKSLDEKTELISSVLETVSAVGTVRAARLKHALWSRFGALHYKQMHILAQVCKKWADILVGSPAFWNQLCGYLSIPSLNRSLRLSANRPLAVNFQFRGHGQTKGEMATLLSLACQHIYRWESASVSVSPEGLAALQTSQAPLLRCLELRVLRERRPEEVEVARTPVLHLFQGHAPHLTELTLSGVGLKDWNSGLLRNLRLLELKHLGDSAPSLQQILNAIRRCNRLEILDLADIRTQGHPERLDTIHIPDITSIAIRHSLPECTAMILNTVRTPKCDHYTVGYTGGSTLLQDALRECMRRVNRLPPAARGENMLISITDDHIDFGETLWRRLRRPDSASHWPTLMVEVDFEAPY